MRTCDIFQQWLLGTTWQSGCLEKVPPLVRSLVTPIPIPMIIVQVTMMNNGRNQLLMFMTMCASEAFYHQRSTVDLPDERGRFSRLFAHSNPLETSCAHLSISSNIVPTYPDPIYRREMLGIL